MNENEILKSLHEECLALELKAGISQQMARAREGRFIPLGAMGEDVSPEEYFADEFDYLRKGMRDSYFSVEDIDLRRRLIALSRKIDNKAAQSFEADADAAQSAISEARRKIMKQPWEIAALWAIGAVAVGYLAFNLVGAIGGAVGGFFIGQGAIARAKGMAQAELEYAENELKNIQKYIRNAALEPEYFSVDEEISGQRDQQLDQKSAYENVLQAQINR